MKTSFLVFALTLIFSMLKLTGVISCSWWVVFMPVFVFIGIIASLFFVIGCLALVAHTVEKINS